MSTNAQSGCGRGEK